ncbi:KH domain-containing, RNA-binding, signal transduction-associated protein 1 [Liparis tanakae]|uniref:KH domain-containing, RNA-binding, signal transduction-associated protein 1 n=1 Tax=Liparis tanakae TaxID=230148 RepID=A0A4Z2E3P7_9TELE|nr:KH domain-containing, RNA-binding, signal transduction-associated protein 1 [Liparis tanakae]
MLKGETTKKEAAAAADAYLDLFTTKNIKLKERVLIPVKQYPKVSGLLSLFFSFTLNPPN